MSDGEITVRLLSKLTEHDVVLKSEREVGRSLSGCVVAPPRRQDSRHLMAFTPTPPGGKLEFT